MQVRFSELHKITLPTVEAESVANAWERLSEIKSNSLLCGCLSLRDSLQLCDWAYLRMLDSLCASLLGTNTNEAELLKAYLFCQSGYQMRLAFDNNRLRMLYACEQTIFDKPYWVIGGMPYYADSCTGRNINICEASFPGEQAMSLSITKEQYFTPKVTAVRTLHSSDTEWLKATVAEDENQLAFFSEYPSSYEGDNMMTRWAMVADVPMNPAARRQLYPQLTHLLQDKGLADAVDVLCHWIQTAFVYEYDDKVWGVDRAFFADETLYYPFCDCEDRSILLTRLVRDLFGVKCALVYYPGHLASAIALGEDVKGDYIRIDGVKYLVCDPTYIGAPIGMTMPGMNNQVAKVIVLR